LKIGNKEITLKKIKGEAAMNLLAMAGNPEKIKDIILHTIKHGSDAKYEDFSLKEIIQLVDEINKFNGFTEDFTKTLEEKSGK